MRAGGLGELVASNSRDYQVGELVQGRTGWQDYVVASASAPMTAIPKIPGFSPSFFLGALGMTGLTAYVGMFDIGQPKRGETVVVSAAAGAVGSVAGQLAKIEGARVVGIAGGPKKSALLTDELGFDAAVDYTATGWRDHLKAATPDGIDVDFENVGGEVLDTALRLTNRHSRIVLCGLVAEYSLTEPYPHRRLRSILVNRIRMQGMIVFDWKERYAEALEGLAKLVAEGRLKYRESIVEGLDNAPQAFIALLGGGNFGKQLVKLA